MLYVVLKIADIDKLHFNLLKLHLGKKKNKVNPTYVFK